MTAAKQTKNAIQTNNIKLTRQLSGSPALANEPAACPDRKQQLLLVRWTIQPGQRLHEFSVQQWQILLLFCF